MIQFLLNAFAKVPGDDAMIWRDRTYSYAWMLEAVRRWSAWLDQRQLPQGSVVSLEADFSPNAAAMLLCLIQRRCILVPLTEAVGNQKPEFRRIAEVEAIIRVGVDDCPIIERANVVASHSLIRKLKEAGHPGLILFSSGSTGKSKAAIHDFVPLLRKFHIPRKRFRTITFLLFDHIGGINTLLYTLSNTGCLVLVDRRSPEAVCALIAKHQAQILPTTPTFINLLLLSRADEQHDLSSLEVVSYGTEVMPESVLRAFHARFPAIQLVQTYGLSELGILRSKSKASDSLWVKVGGDGYQTRIVDGLLEIKAESAMLGYLNAPSPFTEDGWFKTGDAVLVDGEYFRFLGRMSEIINVGGEKVYPAQVEDVLLMMDGVEDVSVSAEASPLIGQVVAARVKLSTPETLAAFRTRMRAHCRQHLSPYQVPQKVMLVEHDFHGARFKKMRRSA